MSFDRCTCCNDCPLCHGKGDRIPCANCQPRAYASELALARAVVEAARVITSHSLFRNSGYEDSPSPGNIWPVIKEMREGIAAYDKAREGEKG